MDALDVAILRAVGVGFKGDAVFDPDAHKPSVIGEKVGVSHQTVKDRLRAMEESGVLEGFLLAPHASADPPTLTAFLYMVDESRKETLLAALETLGCINGYLDFAGSAVLVPILSWSQKEQDERRARVDAALGVPPLATLWRRPFDRKDRDPTLLDFRIIAALLPDPTRSLAEVADEVGVTAKTVRARLDRLMRERYVAIVPYFDRSHMPGMVCAHLVIEPRSRADADDAKAAARDAAGDMVLWARYPPAGDASWFEVCLVARSPAEVEERRRAVARSPAVARCLALFPRRGWDDLTEMRASFAKRMRAAAEAASR